MITTTDSLYLDWISKHYINPAENCTMTTQNPEVSDSIYMDRLQRIPAIIEMPYNDIIRSYRHVLYPSPSKGIIYAERQ